MRARSRLERSGCLGAEAGFGSGWGTAGMAALELGSRAAEVAVAAAYSWLVPGRGSFTVESLAEFSLGLSFNSENFTESYYCL